MIPIISIITIQYDKLYSKNTIITLYHNINLHILLKYLKNTFNQFITIIFFKYFLYYQNIKQKIKPTNIKKINIYLNISINLKIIKITIYHNIPINLKITKKNYHTHLTKITKLLQFTQILNPFINTR